MSSEKLKEYISPHQIAFDKQLAENKRKNEIVRANRLAKEKAERDQKRALQQAEEENNLKIQLRNNFFSVNLSASESDFERLYPTIRDNHFIRRLEAQEKDIQDARNSGLYQM